MSESNVNPNFSTTSNNSNSELQSSLDAATASKHCCKCRIKCDTKRCACFLLTRSCSDKCRCKGNCSNPQNVTNREDKENSSLKMNEIKEVSQENSAGEHSKMPEPLGTPQFKMPRYAKESLSLMPIEKPFDPILFPFFQTLASRFKYTFIQGEVLLIIDKKLIIDIFNHQRQARSWSLNCSQFKVLPSLSVHRIERDGNKRKRETEKRDNKCKFPANRNIEVPYVLM